MITAGLKVQLHRLRKREDDSKSLEVVLPRPTCPGLGRDYRERACVQKKFSQPPLSGFGLQRVGL